MHRLLLLSFLLILLPGPVHAQPRGSAPSIAAVEIGFEGTCRVGKWTPVWVELQAGSSPLEGTLELITPDGDGFPVTYHSLSGPLHLAAGTEARQLVYVKFGRTSTWLEVRVISNDQVLAQRSFPIGSFPSPQPTAREVVLTLGGDAGVAEAAQLSRRRDDDAYLPAQQAEVPLLPDQWFGYESVDTVVLVASNREYLARWSAAQRQALLHWVAQGGKLIVSSGGELPPGWQAVYPGEFAAVESLRRTTALEVYTGATQRLDLVSAASFALPATVLAEPQGQVLLGDLLAGHRQPIFLLTPRGFGLILFSAVDLTAEPLAQWRDRPRLLLRLLRMGDEQEPIVVDTQRSGGRVTHIGYHDLSGQLRAALEAFSFGGRSLVPFSWIAALIVGYIVLIGPVDYFLLRRVIGRMEATWITFPLMAIALAVAAMALTGWYKGDSLAVRQLTLADYDLASDTQRTNLYAHLYSPANARYDISMPGQAESLLSWHGLPGTALGGMETSARGMGSEARWLLSDEPPGRPVHVHPQGVPINAWSTKSFTGQVWSMGDSTSKAVTAEKASLRETYDARLIGQFINPTQYELAECQLLYDRWAYAIRGTLAPGDRVYLADEGEPRDLEWKMTRRVVSEENKPISAPWNPTELNVPRILELLMFHRAAGGVGYTELSHRQLQTLDLSRHLRLGRAVLVGRVPSPPPQLALAGEPLAVDEDSQWMYVRVVIPVEPLNQ